MKWSSCKTLQQCLQQRRRNASLQQAYNIRKTVRKGVSAYVSIPTQ